jgi:hypothetical protein
MNLGTQNTQARFFVLLTAAFSVVCIAYLEDDDKQDWEQITAPPHARHRTPLAPAMPSPIANVLAAPRALPFMIAGCVDRVPEDVRTTSLISADAQVLHCCITALHY